ncbi:MAG: lipoprotein-releasing ABC transporter permease subunit [Sphingomonadales bacterium]
MASGFELMVALRYLKSRRGDGFISIIAGFSLVGISLGVAVLIVVMAVMNGFREELFDKILGLNGHVSVSGYGARIDDYDKLVTSLKAIEGVKEATAMVEGQVMATNKGYASGAIMRGVKASYFNKNEHITPNIVEGDLKNFGEIDSLVLGFRLAQKLGVNVGDKLTLISPKSISTPLGSIPRQQAFTVVATFEVGVYDYDNLFIYIPLQDAQIYYKMGDTASGIEIFIDHPDNIELYLGDIVDTVNDQGIVRDWRQLNHTLFSALEVERNVMFLILTLIIIVAAFNIISSLIMLVKDKSRDVAILRTMGASRNSITKIFIIAGSSIGFIGTLIGVLLGLLLVLNIGSIQSFLTTLTGTELWNPEIRFLTQIPAKMNLTEVIYIVLMSLSLSFIATLPPSWRAAKLEPVEVLRYE